jgi:hypothetical protein
MNADLIAKTGKTERKSVRTMVDRIKESWLIHSTEQISDTWQQDSTAELNLIWHNEETAKSLDDRHGSTKDQLCSISISSGCRPVRSMTIE